MSHYVPSQVFASITTQGKQQKQVSNETVLDKMQSQSYQGREIVNKDRMIQVTAVGEVSLPPDRCRVTVKVHSQKDNVQDVKNSIQRRLDYILQTFQNHNIKETDIQVHKNIRRAESMYVMTTEVIVVFLDFNKCQMACNLLVEKLDESVSVGMPEFYHAGTTLETLRQQASLLAVHNAKQKAQEMAKFVHQAVGRPVSIQEEESKEWEGQIEGISEIETNPTIQQRISQATVTVSCRIILKDKTDIMSPNMTNITVIEDAVFGNDSLITTNWTAMSLGCLSWKQPNHVLFQVANAIFFIGLMCPQIKHGGLVLHGSFVLSFLLLSIWAWVILCAPDYFSWNFAFLIINMIQTFMILYNIKPIKFDENMERLYQTVFQSMNVSRKLFKKLIDQNYCLQSTLYEGDAYAVQGITKTDRLGLLVSGSMKVYSQQNLLHNIEEMEFIDSPEFESSVTGEEKFQVSVYAASTCHYIYWPRQSLEYLLMKEPFLATVLNTIMGRDITNKLYALNHRANKENDAGGLNSNGTKGGNHVGQVGDLRRILAQLSNTVTSTRQQPVTVRDLSGKCLVEEQEDSDGW
ncbi:hypothetical protein ACF0H5_007990 [Mactra antiquata]